MKKQGPPPALDESRISSLKKRKASDFEGTGPGKRRKASGEIPNGTAKSGTKQATNGNFSGSKPSQAQKGRKMAARPGGAVMSGALLDDEISDDDAADLLGDGEDGDESSDHDAADLLGGSDEENESMEHGFTVALHTNKQNRGPLLDGSEDEIVEDGDGISDDFLGSGSDEQEERGRFSDDEDNFEELENLNAANIESRSRRLDQEQAEDAAEAQLELEEAALQTNIDGDRPRILEDEDEDEGVSSRLAPDLQLLRTRITDTIRVLDDFSNRSEEGRSRAEYTAQLLKDICLYYGYSPYLAEKLFNLFPPSEAFAFFEANESARPIVIRTNTLKTHRRELAQSLINRGVTLEPVGKWSKVGLQIFESQVPLGATPEYLAGHYILQAASSFLPVMALAPQENERILDMAAAPGGKTTHIAALMKNTGTIFANDSNKSRAKGLIGNIHRLGARNTIVCNYDATEFPTVIGGFDRVLLDAPCSGTGVMAKDPSVKTNKTERDFMQLPDLQKRLLIHAIDSVDHAGSSKTGGYVVYSTCSVTVEENEQVVQYALKKRPNVKLVETGLTFGKDGFVSYMGKHFDPKMNMTKRYYPHAYNVDGFFVSKFKKTAPSPRAAAANGVANGATDGPDTPWDDRVPISTADEDEEDNFGGFDSSEDAPYLEQGERRRKRKKGINPKADPHKRRSQKTDGVNGTEPNRRKVSEGSGPILKAANTRVK